MQKRPPTSSKSTPIHPSLFTQDLSDPLIYSKQYQLLKKWIQDSMWEYRQEMETALFPLLVHSYLDLVRRDLVPNAISLLDQFKSDHLPKHAQDLVKLSVIQSRIALDTDEWVSQICGAKYPVFMSQYSFQLLLSFLQNNKMMLLLRIINENIRIQVDARKEETEGEEVEAIKLDPLPADPWLIKELENSIKDNAFPPQDMPRMTDELKRIKQEHANSPNRTQVPLPPSKLSDAINQVRVMYETKQKPKSGATICSYTLHNTYDGLTCARLSPDMSLLSAGFSNSSIKIWNVKGYAEGNVLRPSDASKPIKLTGHSGPVYATHFSHDNKYLISSSVNTRLWSLETKLNVAVYKSHNYPIWDVKFSPHGVYFCTASHDRTARLWSTDHAFPLRLYVGHSSDVNAVAWHPNSNYILTGSHDKTARLWDVQRGVCVRILQGAHTAGVACVDVRGDTAVTGGPDGTVLWDLGSGKAISRVDGASHAVSSSGNLVYWAGEYCVGVWDTTESDSSIFYTKRTGLFDVAVGPTGLVYTVGAFSP